MNIDGTLGGKYSAPTSIRPYDFGTDAIERQRVSLGVSLIDADFEYGLQATKWQTYSDIRKMPSFYEIPGTEINSPQYPAVITAAGTTTITVTIPSVVSSAGSAFSITATGASFTVASAAGIAIGQGVWFGTVTGYSAAFSPTVSAISGTTITVVFPTQGSAPTLSGTAYFFNSALPLAGSVLSIVGLANNANDANRAEGFFIIISSTLSSTNFLLTYNSKVGTVTTGTISTSYTTIRRGGTYGGSAALTTPFTRIQTTGATQAGGSGTIVTVTTASYHGLMPGTPIATYNSGTDGNFIITNVSSGTTFQYTPSGALTVANFLAAGTANVFVQPYSYIVHRPFDGGVLINPNIPTYSSTVCRQSKKVFRYQSGKGLLWSSGTLFCPNNDVTNITASGTTLTITSAVPHGAPQPGATIVIKNITTPGYNGTYTVASVVNANQLTVTAPSAPGVSPAVLGDQPRFIMTNWHGASVRAGAFDDQNGLYWEYDGQTLWVVKRSCTFQIAGSVTATQNSNQITGSSTRFTSQLKVSDRITIRGMTYTVISIASDTSMYVTPPYRAATFTVGVTACKIKEVRTPQSLFNRDTIDGKGPSGYKVDLTKMQMVGMQYTWYGAGFVDFMIRGGDGNWVYVHRYRQNNVNDEAYMRTGNMSVRYEVVTETQHAVSTLTNSMGTGDTTLTVNDPLTYWPPAGTVMIDYEQVAYTGISGQTLTGLTRSSTITYNIGDNNVSLTGSSAATHASGASVNLVSCTCAPSLTHWGSAFLMDGNFDSDRGYFFNYQVNSATTLASGTTTNLFLLRLSPSVSNGVVGDLGQRDLLNRAQLLLQRLDVFGGSTTAGSGSTGSLVVSGVLNPSGLTVPAASWISINSPANGSQPSFAQVAVFPTQTTYGNYVIGSGERIFSTINNNGQNSIDLSNLKEVCNAVIGGSGMFPDGPDTLLVQAIVPTGFPAVNSYSVNLFWTEAQA